MRSRTVARAAGATALAAALAGCGGGGGATPSSSLGTPQSTSAAPASTSPAASPTPTVPEPTLGPTVGTGALAAFQLCGTALALAAGYIGQVPAEQLAEGEDAVAAARADYVDDGSGLLGKVDAVVAAVEADDQAAVVATAKTLGTACREFDPGT